MEEINENNPKNEGTSVQHAYNNEAMVNDPEDTTEPLSYEIDETYGLWVGSSNDDLYKGITLAFQQFSALIMKRIINSMRNKTLIISQLVIPVGILLVNLLYVKYAPIKAEGEYYINEKKKLFATIISQFSYLILLRFSTTTNEP